MLPAPHAQKVPGEIAFVKPLHDKDGARVTPGPPSAHRLCEPVQDAPPFGRRSRVGRRDTRCGRLRRARRSRRCVGSWASANRHSTHGAASSPGWAWPNCGSLRQLRHENRKLKQLVADLSLDKHMLQEVLSKKGVKPARKRKVVRYLQDGFRISAEQLLARLRAQSGHSPGTVQNRRTFTRGS